MRKLNTVTYETGYVEYIPTQSQVIGIFLIVIISIIVIILLILVVLDVKMI